MCLVTIVAVRHDGDSQVGDVGEETLDGRLQFALHLIDAPTHRARRVKRVKAISTARALLSPIETKMMQR